MKLSAPPPEPTDPDPTAAAEPGAPAADAPAAGAPKPAAWPAWFTGADLLLVLLAGALAFLVASFAARNNDLWLHLGAGRMLTTGEYALGSDPLSYTAADRPWVNHAWLFDLGAYLLYKADGTGFTLVLAKALAVAAGFGLLMAIRRPGVSRWPWAVLAAAAAVAAAPRLTLGPLTGSVVLLCGTLFVLFRVPSRPGSWRVPLVIGAIFWVWANVDAWFFVGPVVLALLLVGELARGAARTPEEGADPLPLPDAGTLARALAVGAVACMLNPHHVRVWDLPFELVGGGGIEADGRLSALRHLPFSEAYWSDTGTGHQLGYNLNGLAYAGLLLAGLYAAFLSGAVGRLAGPPWDVDPLPLPHAALWFGLAALSLMSVYAVPFLAVATVPLVASRLNLLSARVRPPDRADKAARLVLTGSAAGRVASALALAGLCLAAWPGWLHPPASYWGGPGLDDPSSARRVAWAVEPDPELVKAASWLGEQRAAGRLPADARGVITAVELANYCAYFAPGEKVFVNGRYNHHRPELPDFVAVRAAAEVRPGADPPVDPDRVGRVLDARGASYLVVYDRARQTGVLAGYRRLGLPLPGVLDVYSSPDHWAPWYGDGRAAAFGWRPAPGGERPEWEGLRLSAPVLAFGPAAAGAGADPLRPAPPPRTALDEFLGGPVPPAPAAADEALGWMEYKSLAAGRAAVTQQAAKLLRLNVPGVAVPPLAAVVTQFRSEWGFQQGASVRPEPPADGSFLAGAVLAVRAARRAIAENPAHPDGYYALAQALNDPDLPLDPSERDVGRAAALRQALDRFPPAAEFRRGVYAGSPTMTAYLLAKVYLGRQVSPTEFAGVSLDLAGIRELAGDVVLARGGRVFRVPYLTAVRTGLPAADAQLVDRPTLYPPDLALGALDTALGYAPAEYGSSPPADIQNVLRAMDELRKQLDAAVRRATDQFRTATDPQRAPTARERFRLARRVGLPGEALAILKDLRGDDLGREFGPEAPQTALEMVALELAVGRLEEAAADLTAVRAELDALAARTPPPPGIDDLRRLAQFQQCQVAWLRGDYADAGRLLDELDAPPAGGATKFPPPHLAVGLMPPVAWPNAAVVGGVNRAADVAFWALLRDAALRQARGQLRNIMDNAARFYFRRGLWALLGGDPAAAKALFAQTRREPPPGWDVAAVVSPQALEYIRYIDAAEKRAAGK